jgi:hypothetical protein
VVEEEATSPHRAANRVVVLPGQVSFDGSVTLPPDSLAKRPDVERFTDWARDLSGVGLDVRRR